MSQSQPPNPNLKISRKEAVDALWRKGVLHWKLHSGQKDMHELAKKSEHPIVVIGCSRQLGKCAIEGTPVLTPSGIVPIEQLKIGDLVYGYNKDGSISIAKIKQTFNSGMKEVVDLTNHGVVMATTSLDHEWLITNDNGKTWEERKVKDFVSRSKIRRVFIDVPGGNTNEPHAYVIGAFLGDGCNSANKYFKSNKLVLSSEDNQIPTKISSILNYYITKQKGNNYNWLFTCEPPVGKGKKGKKTNFNYYNEWIKDRKAHEKIVDLNVVKSWNRESQLQFLAGLIDTDGSVQLNGRKNNELTVSYSGQSRSIVEAVRYLIHYHFQYQTKIHTDNRSKYKNGPLFYLSITNNVINKRIIKTLTPYLAKEKKKWKEEYSNLPERNSKSDYVGVKIENKRYAQCYDISIDNDTSLYALANGLITHNSYCMTLLAIEECLQKPNIIVKFIAPKAKDIRRIIAPLIREITQDAPKDLKPKFNSRENIYIFANGSEIQLAGTDNGHAESIRGNKGDLCIIDEAGFCDELDYVVKSILLPTMTRTRGKLIMASTPSKSPDHPFMSFYDEAEVEQRLIKKTIYDNPHLTAEDIDKIALALGGKDSIDFRREYLVERIIDENDAVVPEFNIALQDKVIKEVPRPAFYDNYVSMDIGGRDLTAVVFGYYDFANARIVIEDEYISSKQVLTDEIALNIKNKEKFLWTGKTGEVKTPTLRVADNNNIILLNDLSVKHDLQFIPTLKDNADAQINNMRLLLKAEKIIINPRCVTLISHLKSAIWNKSRTSFARDATKGHFDMIHALVYFCRNVNMNKNPFPAGYAFAGVSNVFYSDPEIKTKETQVETKFKEMFTVKNPRKIRRY